MNTRRKHFPFCLAVLLLAAALSPLARAQDASPQPPTLLAFDLSALDTSADACENFYQYACGGWHAENPIPPEESFWSRTWTQYWNEVDVYARTLIEEAAQSRADRTPDEQRIGDHFAACMDTTAIEERGLRPLRPELAPYFALAEELDVPVAIHTGLGDEGTPYKCCPRFRVTLGNPTLLEEVLVRHPRLRVQLMHAGYPYLQETKAMLFIYPQVYVDIAVLNWVLPRQEFHSYLRALVEAGFGNRILFGSDQMVWPEAIGMAIEGVESATFLTGEQKRDIFYNNAARFLRLPEDTIAGHHEN